MDSKLVVRLSKRTNNVQRAKKVVSHNPGLVDFGIRLVNSVLTLLDRKAKIFRGN